MSSYSNNKRKENVNLLFLTFKFVTIYDINFENILKIYNVIKTDDEELKN